VLPIILRQCLWNHTPFGGLLAMPKDGKAVLSFEDPDCAAAWNKDPGSGVIGAEEGPLIPMV
jgi:hypothetical protein